MGVRGEQVVDVVRIISSLLPRESLVFAPELDRISLSVERRAPTVNQFRFLNPPGLLLYLPEAVISKMARTKSAVCLVYLCDQSQSNIDLLR